MQSSVSSRKIIVQEGCLQLFSEEVVVEALHEFIGFMQIACSILHWYPKVKSKTVILARVDVFIGTVPICVCDDGTDRVGRHRKRMCENTFRYFVSVAYYQLVCVAKRFAGT